MSQPLTNVQFIERSKKKYGDKFDYSKTEYINSSTKICIICPEHGEFWQLPSSHFKGRGCPFCSKELKIKNITYSTFEFIEKARQTHGSKYDYSKVEYTKCRTKVCIICPEHGEFWQKPTNHLNGCGCPKCAYFARKHGNKKFKTTEDFVTKCTKIYGERYDYSKTQYNGANKPIIVFDNIKKCEVITTPTYLLTKKYSTKERMCKENFVKKAKEIHGDKYIYDETEYVNSLTKIKYVCPKHGLIEQLPLNHLRYGCRHCSKEHTARLTSSNTEEFIKKAKEIHGDKYDYSKVNYINTNTKVCITCPKHGEFWQIPSKHLHGHGCPKCNRSHLEDEMSLFLCNNDIKFIEQYAPPFLKNGKGQQRLDFYLPEYKIAIECQGIQHFTDIFYIKSTKSTSIIERDIIKYNKCKNNEITILYYTTKNNLLTKKCCEIYNNENLFLDKDLLLEKINGD